MISDVIDSLDVNIIFFNFDLTSGYFQMALDENSQNLIALIMPMGLYKWNRLQSLMELILSGLSYA